MSLRQGPNNFILGEQESPAWLSTGIQNGVHHLFEYHFKHGIQSKKQSHVLSAAIEITHNY
jgi:hypothetical protein